MTTRRDTERNPADERQQLRHGSQDPFEGIFASVAEGIICIDEQHRIVLFNPAAEQIFGRSAEEMNGQPLSILLPERLPPPPH